jgi:hypothetical protein
MWEILDSRKSKDLALIKEIQKNTLIIPPGKALEGTSVPCIIYSLELKHFGNDKTITVIWKRKHASEELNFKCCLCWTSQFINYNFCILSDK